MDAMPLEEFERRRRENYAKQPGPPAARVNQADAPAVLAEMLSGQPGRMPIVQSGHEIGSMGWTADIELVRLGDVMMPAQIDVEFPGGPGQPSLLATVEFRGGAPGYSRIEIISKSDGRHVLSKDIELVRTMMNHWLNGAIIPSAGMRPGSPIANPDWATEADTRAAVEQARPKSRRRAKVSDAMLQDIATICKAHPRAKDQIRALKDHYNVVPRTAERYKRQAESAGLLPPPTRGPKSRVSQQAAVPVEGPPST